MKLSFGDVEGWVRWGLGIFALVAGVVVATRVIGIVPLRVPGETMAWIYAGALARWVSR